MVVVKCLIKGPFIRECGKSSERILKFLLQTRFGGGLGNGRKINIFVGVVGASALPNDGLLLLHWALMRNGFSALSIVL